MSRAGIRVRMRGMGVLTLFVLYLVVHVLPYEGYLGSDSVTYFVGYRGGSTFCSEFLVLLWYLAQPL